MALFVGLVALALVVAGLSFVIGGPHLKPAPGPEPLPVLLKGDSPEAAFTYLMAANTAADRVASTAVSHACVAQAPESPSRQAAGAQLYQAAATSRSVAAFVRADQVRLAAMPEGQVLVGLLGRVAQASVSADVSFESWIQDLQATGCYSAPTNDLHYIAALRASARGAVLHADLTAAVARERVATLWGPLRQKAGQRLR